MTKVRFRSGLPWPASRTPRAADRGARRAGRGRRHRRPAALSLITTGFPEGPERTRAIGLYGAVSSVGFVAGQVLGGVLVQLTSWRAVFLVNVPVGLIAAALAPAVLGRRGQVARNRIRLDIRGALLITGAVTLVVFAVSQSVVLGWTSPLVIAAVVVAAAAAATIPSRSPAPRASAWCWNTSRGLRGIALLLRGGVLLGLP